MRLSDFGQTSADEVRDAFLAAKQHGVKGYILDLRNNGGGCSMRPSTSRASSSTQGPIVSTIDRAGHREIETRPGKRSAACTARRAGQQIHRQRFGDHRRARFKTTTSRRWSAPRRSVKASCRASTPCPTTARSRSRPRATSPRSAVTFSTKASFRMSYSTSGSIPTDRHPGRQTTRRRQGTIQLAHPLKKNANEATSRPLSWPRRLLVTAATPVCDRARRRTTHPTEATQIYHQLHASDRPTSTRRSNRKRARRRARADARGDPEPRRLQASDDRRSSRRLKRDQQPAPDRRSQAKPPRSPSSRRKLERAPSPTPRSTA